MEVAGGVTEATKALIIKVEGDSPVAGVTGAEVTSTNPMVVAEGDGKPRTANLTRTPGRGASGHPLIRVGFGLSVRGCGTNTG